MSERPAKRAKISDDESRTLQFIEKTVKQVAPWVKDQKLEASADDFAVHATYDLQHCKVAPKGLYLPLHELVDGFLVRMSATVSGALIRHLP